MRTAPLALGNHMSPCPGPSCCLGAQTDINKKGPVLEYFGGPIVTIRLKLYFAMGKMSFNSGQLLKFIRPMQKPGAG